MAELPRGVTLNAHHVHEVADEGPDEEANLRPYCTECHALVHWVRRTLGREDHVEAAPELPVSVQREAAEPRSIFQGRLPGVL